MKCFLIFFLLINFFLILLNSLFFGVLLILVIKLIEFFFSEISVIIMISKFIFKNGINILKKSEKKLNGMVDLGSV